jgi:hypothetical protein
LADVLPADLVGRALAAVGSLRYDWGYVPPVTPWSFVDQALSPDPSCRAARGRPAERGASPGRLWYN